MPTPNKKKKFALRSKPVTAATPVVTQFKRPLPTAEEPKISHNVLTYKGMEYKWLVFADHDNPAIHRLQIWSGPRLIYDRLTPQSPIAEEFVLTKIAKIR